jgi:hypothetical protein
LGFRVIGKLPPTMVKPFPLMDAEFTVIGEVPMEVSVIVWAVGDPTGTLPKLRLVVLTVNCGLAGAIPIPARDTTAVLSVAELLLTVSCPVAGPATVGLN